MTSETPVVIRNLGLRYGQRTALHDLSLEVQSGELFGLLGPNGSGKSTLFRILGTQLPPGTGEARVWGLDVVRDAVAVRHRIGVVFQSPALDGLLTVRENLLHQGRLYGLGGRHLTRRIDELLERLALAERRDDRVAVLSGGLRRRVDIARGILHEPSLLLLDEPSAGLDPGARRDLWQELARLREQAGLTILVTTHLMEEGERCDRVAILDAGRLVGLAPPSQLRAEIGGSVVTLQSADPGTLCRKISERFGVAAQLLDGTVRIEHQDGHTLVPRLAEAFPDAIASMTVQAPTLEDVFVHRTGHAFHDAEQRDTQQAEEEAP